jgi:hypothetical protein
LRGGNHRENLRIKRLFTWERRCISQDLWQLIEKLFGKVVPPNDDDVGFLRLREKIRALSRANNNARAATQTFAQNNRLSLVFS